jgi:hypothetical protein
VGPHVTALARRVQLSKVNASAFIHFQTKKIPIRPPQIMAPMAGLKRTRPPQDSEDLEVESATSHLRQRHEGVRLQLIPLGMPTNYSVEKARATDTY